MQRQRLLLRMHRGNVNDDREKGEYCWVIEYDDNFLRNKIPLTYPRPINRLLNKHRLEYNNDSEFIGSDHGLLCFTGCYVVEDDCFSRYVIWNPSIRKSIITDVPYYDHVHVGFGVCPNSLDPKIVRMNSFFVPYYKVEDKLECTCVYRVEVFTLSAGVWRSPLIKFPSKWFDIGLENQTPVALNEFIYWPAYAGHVGKCDTIILFNLTTEEFTKMQLPDELAHRTYRDEMFKLFNLKGSLGVVDSDYVPPSTYTFSKEVHNVWLMDHVSKSFIKMYTVTLPYRWKVVGLRDNNQLIIEKYLEDFKYSEERGLFQYVTELATYEPNSEQFDKLWLNVDCSTFTFYTAYEPYSKYEFYKIGLNFGFFSFTSYTESLLLLDQSDTLNDDHGDV